MAGTLTKRPIQVYLRPQQLDALRCAAQRRKVSMAELVRQGVDLVLDGVPAEEDSLWDLVGLVKSGPSDLAEKHDEYLAKLVSDENRS
jgi:hypothetical protein